MSITSKRVFACTPQTERGRPIVIGGDPKGKKFLYATGNNIVIRDIADPTIAETVSHHAKPTTCAKYSPSGFYIASGDVSGKVKIWDTTQAEHLVKFEYQPLSGAVKDIAWSEDSKRLAVVGEGREQFGSVFLWDSGSSVGTIQTHVKSVNSIDFRQQRPFRIVTASEDMHSAIFEGPPFKFMKTMEDHSNFVNVVRYSPNGEVFGTGGADGKAFIYDGKTGELLKELGGGRAHKGGIYGLCFSPDSSQVMTCSGDKTVKVWDVEAAAQVMEFTLGTTVEDMQVGCLWQGDYMISVSLSGYINYLDKNNPTEPMRIVKGHSKLITSMALASDKRLFTASFIPKIFQWNTTSGACEDVQGSGHKSQVSCLHWSEDMLTTCGVDDTARFISTESLEYTAEVAAMSSQPKALSTKPGVAVVLCTDHICLLRKGKVVFKAQAPYEPVSVDIHPNLSRVAIGGTKSKAVHLYDISGDTLSEARTLSCAGAVMCVRYTDAGDFLAAGDDAKRVYMWSSEGEEKEATTHSGHSAKINCLAWSPDGTHLCSAGLDTNIVLWQRGKTIKSCIFKGAHPVSNITGLEFLDNNTLASAGSDGCVRLWNVSF